MRERNLFKRVFVSVLGVAVTMLLLSVIVFYFARLAPGDPLQSFYGDAVESMTSSELMRAKERLGLNAPIYVQYIKWLGGVFHGDFGLSLKYKIPAMEVIRPLIGNTLVLGVLAYIIIFALAVITAVLCAANEDTVFDRIICKTGTALYTAVLAWSCAHTGIQH